MLFMGEMIIIFNNHVNNINVLTDAMLGKIPVSGFPFRDYRMMSS